jgi:acyl-CoA synthetase (NDP forming)
VDRVAAAAAAALEFPTLVPGRIGVVSQSGGLALGSMLYSGLEQGVGFSHLVSSGNEADLDIVDFADFLVDDPSTDVIVLTLEAVRDVPCRRAPRARRTPTSRCCAWSGCTELGQAMAASHTGAPPLAGVFAVVWRAWRDTVRRYRRKPSLAQASRAAARASRPDRGAAGRRVRGARCRGVTSG